MPAGSRCTPSAEFTALVSWLRELTDRIGMGLSGAPRDRMQEIFRTSSNYELAFWEMAWTLQTWPLLNRTSDPPEARHPTPGVQGR